MTSNHWLIALTCIMFSAPLGAQSSPARNTMQGVYNREQAERGQDAYLGYCRSCHTLESHSSPTFQATWNGRGLNELFAYIAERMPKNDPGSLSPQEYVDVLAYLLRLNRLPHGDRELPADSAALRAIRFKAVAHVRKDQ